jgi:hypothetical protein
VPNGQGFGGQGFGQRSTGTVASVSGDVITITETDASTKATTERAVTVTGTTSYTKTSTAASDVLVVGKCAVVQGSADSKGAVAATSIAVSSPAAGTTTCNPGFTGRGGRTGPGGNGGNGGAAPTGTPGG